MKYALFLLLAFTAHAQDLDYHRQWTYSATFLASGAAADIISSRGLYEEDPLLGRGQFGAKQVLARAAGVGLSIGVQYVILRHHPQWARRIAWLNVASGGLAWGAAGHNWRLR